jgi:hypothetical protein
VCFIKKNSHSCHRDLLVYRLIECTINFFTQLCLLLFRVPNNVCRLYGNGYNGNVKLLKLEKANG